MRPRRRVAFVVDRFAPTTFGGAPLYAHRLAVHLRDRFDVEVLTTTAQDYMTWANAFAPGVEEIDGVPVRRFSIDVTRDVAAFDRRSKRLLRTPFPSRAQQERWMGAQGPLSLGLLHYLADHRESYDAFVFVSYLYATTYFGLPLVADRAVFVPLTHDEWMLRFPMWNRIFALPRGFVYNTAEERALTVRRFRGTDVNGPVIGLGIDPPVGADGQRFRTRYGLTRPFALYLGRVDPSKGCERLVESFARTRRRHGLDLVLVGEPYMRVPSVPGLHATGAVDEATKWDALDACEVLVLPSRYESLSLVALEAWASGVPVLADAHADAVAGQIARSGGGRTYRTDRAFGRALQALSGPEGRAAGERGRAFVQATYGWETVAEQFAAHLATALRWDVRRRLRGSSRSA